MRHPAEVECGEPYAAAHPELSIRRFLVPFFEIATGHPPSDEYRCQEGAELVRTAEPLFRERRPDVILIGRESFAWHVPQLARTWGCPCVLLARGNPTRLILDGAYPPAQAEYFLRQLRSVDLIVTVAEHLARGLRGLGIRHVMSIPNAVDVDAFVPRPRSSALCRAWAVAPDATVVLHLSNLSPLKRPGDLLRAVGRTLPPLPGLVCVIVGDGPLRSALEEEGARLGIGHALRFTGWVEHGRVVEFINLADLVAMPSAAEGLARAYLEAQACERVLVASDIPAAREVVTHGITGLLFRTGDDEDLARQIVRAATDSDLRASIGRNARAQVACRHAIPEMVTAYETVLAGVVAARAPGASGETSPVPSTRPCPRRRQARSTGVRRPT